MDKHETWQNAVPGTVIFKRLDHRGEMVRIETVPGGRTFSITTEERRQNSVEAANADLDPFRNGMLTPVRLLDDSDEARELASNPNVMSESEMRTLVKGVAKTFDKRLAEVRNPATLERLLAMAHTEDAPVKRVEAIQSRLEEMQPALSGGPREVRAPRPVTPR